MGSKVLDVPYFSHGPGWCSEDTFAMILNYYGIQITPRELRERGCPVLEKMVGCFPPELACTLKEGFTIEDVQQMINDGRPFAMRVIPDGQDWRHSIVIIGYDDHNFIVNDQGIGVPRLPYSYEKIRRIWARTNYYGLCCRPRDGNPKPKKTKIEKELEDIRKRLSSIEIALMQTRVQPRAKQLTKQERRALELIPSPKVEEYVPFMDCKAPINLCIVESIRVISGVPGAVSLGRQITPTDPKLHNPLAWIEYKDLGWTEVRRGWWHQECWQTAMNVMSEEEAVERIQRRIKEEFKA